MTFALPSFAAGEPTTKGSRMTLAKRLATTRTKRTPTFLIARMLVVAPMVVPSGCAAVVDTAPEAELELFQEEGDIGIWGEYRLGDERVRFSIHRVVTEVADDGSRSYRDAEPGESEFEIDANFVDVARQVRVLREGRSFDLEFEGDHSLGRSDLERALELIGDATVLVASDMALPAPERTAAAELTESLPGSGEPRFESTLLPGGDDHPCELRAYSAQFIAPYYVFATGFAECEAPPVAVDGGNFFGEVILRAEKHPTWQNFYTRLGRAPLADGNAIPWDVGVHVREAKACRGDHKYNFRNTAYVWQYGDGIGSCNFFGCENDVGKEHKKKHVGSTDTGNCGG
jgi:hypothetical protein